MILLDVPRALFAPLRAIVAIEQEIRGLRDDVRSLQAGVDRIGDSTVNLETKVDELGVHLDAVGALATRFGRLGARRP